ncbi:sel1-repeat-containing protein ybeq [Anaeramoeba flamelloides]|uniref:Sel1-repeat-containing protein ybeq n=1 Tax=Anaeramoeba flamelloides TaxID=1746091 RepID=A0AAV7YP61_9EUKA|nr:sel1-repeat-containing protein ybeq [Anaeramoeba flamelloides]
MNITLLKNQSKRNNAKAQAKLGFLYYEGIHVQQNISKAIKLFLESSKQGNAEAFYNLGELYFQGKYVKKNLGLAYTYFKHASVKGHPTALSQLADLEFLKANPQSILKALFLWFRASEDGSSHADHRLMSCFKNTPKDLVRKVIHLLEEGSQTNDAKCLNLLATLLVKGNGIAQNKRRAFQLFRKSSKLNNLAGIRNYGTCFSDGIGCEKNDSKSFKLFQRAAKRSYPRAQNSLAFCYLVGEGCELDVYQAKILLESAARKLNLAALNNLGTIYTNGEAVEINYKRSLKYFFKGHRFGYSFATTNLGNIFERGKGVVQNYETAFKYYKIAAQMGDPQAQFNLAECYKEGQGTEKNEKLCFYWHKSAAKLKYVPSINNLGIMYEAGIGVEKNLSKAFKRYQEGAELSNEYSQYNLAICYRRGEKGMVEQDLEKSYDWYSEAAKNGHESSIKIVKNKSKLIFMIDQKISLEKLEKSIKGGVEMNKQDGDGNTGLHLMAEWDVYDQEKYLLFLLEYGCDIWIKNNKQETVIDLLKKKIQSLEKMKGKTKNGKQKMEKASKIIQKLLAENSIRDDFSLFFQRKEMTDCQIKNIKVFKIFIEMRLQCSVEQINEKLKTYSTDILNQFFKWLYCGITNNAQLIKKICLQFNINFAQKGSKTGLVSDLKKIFHLNKTKDFAIIVNNSKLFVHKFILQARSQLFRSMFVVIGDNLNQVGDYSEKSLNSLNKIIQFLYTEELDLSEEENPQQLIKELHDAVEYYQLNKHSKLELCIKREYQKLKLEK